MSTGCSGTRSGARRQPLAQIVEGCKVLSFRLARRRPFDPEPAVAALATAWDEAVASLDDVVA